jgi:hypothetical protein
VRGPDVRMRQRRTRMCRSFRPEPSHLHR